MAFYGQGKGKRSQQRMGGILQSSFQKEKVNELFLIIVTALCLLAVVLSFFDR
jgi:predicted nucleic acid-binding Zn ribbon protein